MLLKHGRSLQEVTTLYDARATAELLLVSGYNAGVVASCQGSCDFSQAPVSGMNATFQALAAAYVRAAAVAGATLVHDAAFTNWEQALDDVAATRVENDDETGGLAAEL